jgi:hypothetical protein
MRIARSTVRRPRRMDGNVFAAQAPHVEKFRTAFVHIQVMQLPTWGGSGAPSADPLSDQRRHLRREVARRRVERLCSLVPARGAALGGRKK